MENGDIKKIRSDLNMFVGCHLGEIYVNEEMAKLAGINVTISFVGPVFVKNDNVTQYYFVNDFPWYWTAEMFE